jgi:transcriptional regulator with XRE-family HTH domain
MPKSVYTDAYASMIKTLVALRQKRGVSQVELANRIGREQPFVSRIERGQRRIDLVEFCVIVRAIGEDPASVAAQICQIIPPDMAL